MTPQPRIRIRRRHWLVEPTYQLKVTGAFLAFVLLFEAISLGLMYYALWDTWRALELWHERVFVALFNAVAWMVLVELIVALPILVVIGILVTHRFVGPLHRIKAALDQIGQGNFVVHLKLRKGDVLTELAESVNRLAGSLQRR